MISPVTHFLPLTTLRRARILPVGGQVLVRVGQELNAAEIIAEAIIEHKHIMIDIRRTLGINRRPRGMELTNRKPGEFIQKDDVIAETKGPFKRVLRSPVSGRIISVSGGQVMVELEGQRMQLRAGISGRVAEIIPERGAILESNGALLQGVWGNNHVNQGVLQTLVNSPEDFITYDRLNPGMRGFIIFGGHCNDTGVIQAAEELQLNGFIFGSMSSTLISTALKATVPVIVLEGFGQLPINRVAYKILTTNEKRDICLNAAAWNAFSGERPEVFIPLPAVGQTAPETDDFTPGQTVRVHGGKYASQVGKLIDLRPSQVVLPSGLRAWAGSIQFDQGEIVVLPLANLDVLE